MKLSEKALGIKPSSTLSITEKAGILRSEGKNVISLSLIHIFSLGMTSTGEYCDFEFTREEDTEEIVRKLNSVMNDGIEAVSYTHLYGT